MKRLFLIAVFALFFALFSCAAEEQEKIEVPFTPQAPQGNWSEPWQNACEETSILMVDNFYEGETPSREEARQQILKILKTKEREFSFSQDESLQKIVEIINAADLGWQGRIVENPSVEELQEEMRAKRPVIVPVYAPILENTSYDGGGPDYHVFVLTGYDEATAEFLVHDPGTAQGEFLRFKYDNLLAAIHDYDPEKYTDGRKAVLFTSPGNWESFFDKLLAPAPNEAEEKNELPIIGGALLIVIIGFGLWWKFRGRKLT